MWNQLIQSKKFISALAGLITIVLIHVIKATTGIEVDEISLTTLITAVISAYLVGQGIADSGKEAARISNRLDTLSSQSSKDKTHVDL
jgi:hypothetical protein